LNSENAVAKDDVPAAHYRPGAIVFHWAMFVLIVIVGVLGLLHDSWPDQTQAFWINVHALFGIFLWALLLVRFGYRLRHSPPLCPRILVRSLAAFRAQCTSRSMR
jgi:cytochrome b561